MNEWFKVLPNFSSAKMWVLKLSIYQKATISLKMDVILFHCDTKVLEIEQTQLDSMKNLAQANCCHGSILNFFYFTFKTVLGSPGGYLSIVHFWLYEIS